MNTKPFAYQQEDVERLEGEFAGRCLLSLEMGLGKTFEILYYLHRNPQIRPAIVVCPASLKWMWQEQARLHFGMRADVLGGTKPDKLSLPRNPKLLIVNYDVLGRRRGIGSGPGWIDYLRGIDPQLVVLDECHYLADGRSQRTKWVRKLCEGLPRILALSGTPLTNRPADLFPTLNLLAPETFPSWWNYAFKFCSPKKNHWGWDFRGASNLPELNHHLQSLMIRRRKEDVLKDLPPKIRSTVPVDMSIDSRTEYNQAHSDFIRWLMARAPDRAYRAAQAEALVKVGYLKRLAGNLKMKAVCEWIDDFLSESDGKLVVFAIHKIVIQQLMEKYGKIAVKIDGSVPISDRKTAVERFQKNENCRIFIGNVKAAGVGITLTAASTVLFVEFPWAPGDLIQAEDRLHRIGQQDSVNVYHLVARDTIESKLVNILQSKQGTISKVLDNGEGDGLAIYNQLLDELVKEAINDREQVRAGVSVD